jgi:two-component system chemotaxis response regulator CheY
MCSREFKIMVCDDSILIRKQLREIIAEAGITNIIEASNGEEAIRIAKEHQPKLVLLDIVMPGINGVETLKEIKKIDPSIQVVMVSSSGTQSHLKKSLDAGAIDFIQKPWEKEQILSIINSIR